MVTDTIADTLTRIRNAQLAGHQSVVLPKSRMVVSLLQVLSNEGFIGSIEDYDALNGGGFAKVKVMLRYLPDGRPLVAKCDRVSKPGRRIYTKADELKARKSGLGIAVVSTSQGVMSDRQARRLGVGGELLAIVA